MTQWLKSIWQSDSMVQINRTSSQNAGGDPLSPVDVGDHEEAKCRLVYSKSKVYVNPTAYARDNIPGFVALVKRVCGLMPRLDFKANRN